MQVKELNEFIEQMLHKRAEKDDLKSQLDLINKGIAKDNAKMLQHLEDLDMEKYSHPKATIYTINKFSLKVPKDEENKGKLFAWLKERGIEMQYLTVNSKSINSLFKAEMETSEDPDFEIPGIGKPKHYAELGVRRI